MKHPIHVTSEIGELQTVLLKRPGKEVENLTPDYLQQLLFDDIPYLPIIQKSMITLHKRYAIGVLKFFI